MERSPASPVAAVLARLDAARRNGSGWSARCPAHDDAVPSLSVSEGHDGRVLLHCHAGCTPEAVLAALEMTPADLFPDPASTGAGRPEVVATYPYTDEDGNLLFEVVRMHPKTFRQRVPDGRGGWIWRLGDTRRVLYRLPEVVRAVREGRTVYVVEGEKDADRLAGLGVCATTAPGGAGKWRSEYSEPLRGARVVVLPDNDEPGRAHAEMVARALRAVSADVRVVHLPGLPAKGDVSDWLDAGGTVEELERLLRETPAPADTPSKIGPPMSIADLLAVEEPAERWIVPGLIPADANVLVAGYPKTHKTNFALAFGVSATTASPFLGRFEVPAAFRVGLVLMEDRAHRIRRRLERLAQGCGYELGDLNDWLFLWFRPSLRLSDRVAMKELGEWVARMDLDALWIDNWSLVSTGNSNDADEVTPQLDALTELRESRPGLTVILTHHARKAGQDRGAERLTDIIRNSSAFGAWYDVGVVLSRKDELSPVTVRAELRDLPSPEPFSFTVEDQFPAGPDYGVQPGGWLKLVASDKNPALVEREAQAERFKGAVLEYLRANPGCSKRQLREGIEGNNELILAAFDALVEEGSARFEEPKKRGQAGRCYTTVPDRAQSVPGAHPEVTVPTVPTAPYRGGHGAHFHPEGPGDRAGHTPSRSDTYPCAECGQHRFAKPGMVCFGCRRAKGAA